MITITRWRMINADAWKFFGKQRLDEAGAEKREP